MPLTDGHFSSIIWLQQKCVLSQSCPTLCNPMDCSLPGSSVHGGKNTRVGCHFLLQGIFPTQGSNLHLLLPLHWQEDSSPLRHLGNPKAKCHLPTQALKQFFHPLFPGIDLHAPGNCWVIDQILRVEPRTMHNAHVTWARKNTMFICGSFIPVI